MVLDPITSISLAANILQLIGLGIKVASEGAEFYQSKDGMLSEQREIAKTIGRLAVLRQGLEESLKTVRESRELTPNEIELRCIVEECCSITNGLALYPQDAKAGSYRRAMNSAWKAIAWFREKEKMDHRMKRLNQLREQFMSHYLVVIHSEQRNHASKLNRLDDNQRSILNAINNLDHESKLRQKCLSLQTQTPGAEGYDQQGIVKQNFEEAEKGLLLLLLRPDHADLPEINVGLKPSAHISTTLDDHIAPRLESHAITSSLIDRATQMVQDSVARRQKRMETQLLESLRFESIKIRRETIDPHHKRTFSWIFDPPKPLQNLWSDFPTWAQGEHDGNGVYWISGLPGSGKSTLMRYLWEDRDVKEMLRQWAGSGKLVIAACFFWLAGTELQKSLIGLLRSLLYDLLVPLPHLIRSAFPSRWDTLNSGLTIADPWSEAELENALKRIINGDDGTIHTCIFIDGLDEFDGTDRQRANLISFLKELSSLPRVKTCVSSRNWSIFSDAFQAAPSLQVEKMTKQDIKDYVDTELVQFDLFQHLSISEPEACGNIAKDVVDMANGIFLWVTLVVSELKTSLQDDFSVKALSKRLREIPIGLDKYLKKIFTSINVRYRAEAARIFSVMEKTTGKFYGLGDIDLLSLYFTDTEDNEFCSQISLQSLTEPEVEAREEAMSRRLKSRCQGLIRVYTLWDFHAYGRRRHAELIHRTVMEILNTDEIHDMWNRYLNRPFDPIFYRFQAALAESKMLRPTSYSIAQKQLEEIFHWAEIWQNDHAEKVAEMLFAFEKVIQDRFTQIVKPKPDEYTGFKMVLPLGSAHFLLESAFRFNVDAYVLFRLSKDPSLYTSHAWEGGLSTLEVALGLRSSMLGSDPLNVKIIRLTLMHESCSPPNELSGYRDIPKEEPGVLPERRYSDRLYVPENSPNETIWSRFLRILAQDHIYAPFDTWYESVQVTELLIRAGASRYGPNILKVIDPIDQIHEDNHRTSTDVEDYTETISKIIVEPYGSRLAILLEQETSWSNKVYQSFSQYVPWIAPVKRNLVLDICPTERDDTDGP